MLLYMLAVRFAAQTGRLAQEAEGELLAELKALPGKVAEMLGQTGALQRHGAASVGYKSIFFIGRNVDYAIALEGSLKLKEISYIHSEAYAGGELKHGPIALIEENTLVVAISNCGRLYDKMVSNMEQVIARGAKVLLIGCCPIPEPNDRLAFIGLPRAQELFSASLSVVALQLFAYYVAVNKGLDIDKPRNLAKSVTVE
jgi:glucosamine--fructose-6-phosphate aminotransferase (isomerizing)